MYKITITFESNIKNVYTTHIETCTAEYLDMKLLRNVNYFFNIFCTNDEYNKIKNTVISDSFGIESLNLKSEKEIKNKLFLIDKKIDIMNRADLDSVNKHCLDVWVEEIKD
jgi:hypothetical protein